MKGSAGRRRWRWVPPVAAFAALGVGVVWSANGTDMTRPERARVEPTYTVQLRVDEAYYEAVGPPVPGQVAGAPILEDKEPVPVGGPRAKPGLASVLVYMAEGTVASAVERADVRAFAARRRSAASALAPP